MKILLIDDHKLFSLSIQMILKSSKEIEVVDVLHNICELQKIDVTYYDIVLVDINLTNITEETGLDLAQRLIGENEIISVVILTGHAKQMYEEKANKIGAKGFIDKNIEPEKLVEALKSIYEGGSYFRNISTSVDEMLEKLSEQEIKVLELTRKGVAVEDIGQMLYISRRTVFNHLGNIYSKLHVNNKQEAVYRAEQLGYFLDF